MELSRDRIIQFIADKHNVYQVIDIITYINDYDNSMQTLCYHDNDDEFFDIYFGINTMQAVRAVCYGDYKYADDYVKFDELGNLESANIYEIMAEYDFNKEDIADKIIEVAEFLDDYIDLPEEFFLN